MRIVVAFKVTPDFEALREADWARVAAGTLDLGYVPHVLNCFDESALELALRLADARAEGLDGEATSLGAVTIGGREAEPFLKTLAALGYERAARVAPGADLDVAPEETAALLAGYVRQSGGCDLLLTGSRCGPGDSGLVPFLVAGMLGRPCLSDVVELAALPGGRLRVTWAAARGLCTATVRPPCVLAVGNAVVSHLRVPTLRDRLAAQERTIAELTPADLGVETERASDEARRALQGLAAVDRSRAGVLVEGATPREQAAALYEGYLRERLASNRPRTPERRTDTAVLATGMGSEGRAPRIFAVVDATGAGADPGRQARALAGFLRRGLGGVSAEARAAVRTLLICSGQADAEQLAAEAPTRLVHVLRVSGRDAGDVGRALIRRADNGGDVLFVLPPGPVGARLAARLALAHGGSAVSGVLDATFDAEGRLQAHARVFSGHLVGRLALAASPWCLAVDSFWQDEPAAPFAAHEVVEESLITPAGPEGHTPWLDELTLAPGPASDDLAGAGLLLAVGQGAGGRDGVSRLAAVAARIGAAFGASRPVVMNAWAPMDRLVGVSGTRTAPDVCIAAGASGAPAFLWGIERAGFLVAVNTDPQAPLLRAADVAVVGDAVAVSEALAEVMAADREAS